ESVRASQRRLKDRLWGLLCRGHQARRALRRPRQGDLQAVREPLRSRRVGEVSAFSTRRRKRIDKARPSRSGRAFVFGSSGGRLRLRSWRRRDYCATRKLESAVPIWLKVATISFAEVSRKNLSGSGYLPGLPAHLCSSVEVGSPPVLTCTV